MPHTITTTGLQTGVYRIIEDDSSERNETASDLSGSFSKKRSGSGFDATGSGFNTPRTGSGINRNRTGIGFAKTKTANGIHRNGNIGGSFKETSNWIVDTNGIQRNGSVGGSFKETGNGPIDRNHPVSGFTRTNSGNGFNRSRPGSGRVSPITTVPPSPTGSEVNILPGQLSTRLSVVTIHVDDKVEYIACCGPETSRCTVAWKLLACVLAGILFGWCMEKSRVFEPASIRLQMVFRRWIMLKMFLAAVASGQVTMGLLSLLPKFKPKFHESLEAFGACFAENKGVLTSTLGPFILGSGMTLSGACPGMVLAQVGAWSKNSIFTLIGCLVGALIYGLVAPYVVRITKPRTPFKKHTVHHKLGLPFAALALPMAVLLAVTVFLMEWFIPWAGDLDDYNRNDFDLDLQNMTEFSGNIFTAKSWPPSVSGVLIGLLQVVIILTVTDTLGGSSSYATVVSQWVVTDRLQEYFPYLANARTGIGNWWQVFYVCGAVLGGLFSSLASASVATTKGSSVLTALFGGLLMLLGARLGAGCTSCRYLSGIKSGPRAVCLGCISLVFVRSLLLYRGWMIPSHFYFILPVAIDWDMSVLDENSSTGIGRNASQEDRPAMPRQRFSALIGGRGLAPKGADNQGHQGRAGMSSSQDQESAIKAARNITVSHYDKQGCLSTSGSRNQSHGSSHNNEDEEPMKMGLPTPVTLAPAPVQDIRKEVLKRKTKYTLDEYFTNHDLKKAMAYIKEVPPHQLHTFTDTVINHALEHSEAARHMTGTLLHDLVKTGVLSVDQYLQGLKETLEFAEDMQIDIPKIWLYLGQLIGPMVQDGSVPLSFLKLACEPLLQSSKAGLLVAEILNNAVHRLGHVQVGEQWKKSGLQWSEFVQTDVEQFIKDNKLEYTLEEKQMAGPALSDEKVQVELERLVKEKKAATEVVIYWVDTHVTEDNVKKPAFIRALMTAVCSSAITGHMDKWGVDVETVKKRGDLLRHYLIGHDPVLELQALYALQALIHKLQHPQDVLRIFFDTLYDEDIISEDAFKQWDNSTDTAEQAGRGAARKSMFMFFRWLREAGGGAGKLVMGKQ